MRVEILRGFVLRPGVIVEAGLIVEVSAREAVQMFYLDRAQPYTEATDNNQDVLQVPAETTPPGKKWGRK